MTVSQFLKWLMVPALVICVASAAPARPTTEAAPSEEPIHVEGDSAQSVADDRVIRMVDFDLCWPANDQEYRTLGKHAVLMLTASSIHPGDLPLASAYIQADGATVRLERIAVFASRANPAEGLKQPHTSQVSFYLLPIHLLKTDSRLLVDFAGQRKGFGVTDFSKQTILNPRLPFAVRSDANDSPSKPDRHALQSLLVREYPDYF